MTLKDTKDGISKQLQKKPRQIDYVTRPPENLGEQSQPSESLTKHRRTYAQVVKYGPVKVSEDRSPIVTDKRDASDNEVDHTKLFRDFLKEPQGNRTIERIVAIIPKDAVGCNLDDKDYCPSMIGFQYVWTDLKDIAAGLLHRREWRIRVHEPNPRDPVGCPTEGRWTLRIKLKEQDMDIQGQFHHYTKSHETPHYDRKIADGTHIPIQTPDPYISPIVYPEHYGREK